jgi:hypothetical protein
MAQACLVAFNIVCSYNGTKDLVQEHIASKVWPLVYEWEIPKETTDSSIPVAAVETTTAQLEKSEPESSRTKQQPKLQSTLAMVGLSKTTTVLAVTPRKERRMASVLDAVLKPSKTTTLVPTKIFEGKVDELKMTSDEATLPDSAKVGPMETRPLEQACESLPKKITLPTPEPDSQGDFGYIIRHALGKQLSEQQVGKVQHYAKDLKYPRGSLVYGGNDKDDYLYCLSDNKEIDVCQELMDNMGYPKLELGLPAGLKGQLADCLAYNSLKVCTFYFCICYFMFLFFRKVFGKRFVVMLIIIIYLYVFCLLGSYS